MTQHLAYPSSSRPLMEGSSEGTHTHTELLPDRTLMPLLAVLSDVHLHLHYECAHAVLPEKAYEAHGPFALAGAGAVRPSLASLVYDAPAVGGALATSPADRASNWRLRHFGNAVERR